MKLISSIKIITIIIILHVTFRRNLILFVSPVKIWKENRLTPTFLSLPGQGKTSLHFFLQLLLLAFMTFFQYGNIRRAKELRTFGLHKTDRTWLVLSCLHTARGATQDQMREAWTRGWRARGFTRGMKMCDEKWGRVRSRKNTVLDYWKFTLCVYRNCIGQSFALAEIKTAIAMILRK